MINECTSFYTTNFGNKIFPFHASEVTSMQSSSVHGAFPDPRAKKEQSRDDATGVTWRKTNHFT